MRKPSEFVSKPETHGAHSKSTRITVCSRVAPMWTQFEYLDTGYYMDSPTKPDRGRRESATNLWHIQARGKQGLCKATRLKSQTQLEFLPAVNGTPGIEVAQTVAVVKTTKTFARKAQQVMSYTLGSLRKLPILYHCHTKAWPYSSFLLQRWHVMWRNTSHVPDLDGSLCYSIAKNPPELT